MNTSLLNKRPITISFKKAAIASVAIFLAHGQSAKATTLLNDTFADNDRTNQSLTSSAAWYQGGAADQSFTISAATGALKVNSTTTWNPVMTGYFTNSGQVALLVGETISLSFNASFSAVNAIDSTNAFRFGIYNSSGGTRQAADVTIPASGNNFSGFNGYTGYSAFGGVGTTVTAGEKVGVYERAAGGSNTLPMGGANNTLLGSGTPYVSNTINGVTTYSFSLSLTRTALGLDYSLNYAGLTVLGSDTTPVTTSFDTLSFFWLTDAGGLQSSMTLDNVNVSVVPEPSTCMLLGLGIGTLCLLRRRASSQG